MPPSYTKPLSIFINDKCFDVVARNVIMLLLVLNAPDHSETTCCIIHLWYSSFIRTSDVALINKHVRPLIADVCGKISLRSAECLHVKTWHFGTCSIRVALKKAAWEKLLDFLASPVTYHDAQKLRTSATMSLSPVLLDERQHMHLSRQPQHRLSLERFSQDGILLPFGHSRADFNVPNP